MSEVLASRLRQARGSLSLSEAASRAGIPETRIRMYEEGVRQPYGKTLRRLAEAYGAPVVELVPSETVARTPAPARQRRRRRRVATPEEGRHVIEIPIDVREGEPIRVNLELILRPRQAAPQRPLGELAIQGQRQAAQPAEISIALAAQPDGQTLSAFREAYDAFRRERR